MSNKEVAANIATALTEAMLDPNKGDLFHSEEHEITHDSVKELVEEIDPDELPVGQVVKIRRYIEIEPVYAVYTGESEEDLEVFLTEAEADEAANKVEVDESEDE